uniref:C-type lectin domain-containing protein n=1 Tax=Periophthalmus magnuspinnatus TaxID=409849 RepID=A0A3B4B9Y7_9GOBI
MGNQGMDRIVPDPLRLGRPEPEHFPELGTCLLFGSKGQSMEYHLINLRLNWTDASLYCNLFHTDLATVPTSDDLLSLGTVDMRTERSWIGLVDDPISWKDVSQDNANSWKYSATDASIPYANWGPSEPDFGNAEETCVILNSNTTWADHNCAEKLPAIFCPRC